MARISIDEVYRLAALAKIELSDSEAVRLRGELRAIFKMIEQLNRINTTNVEPTAQVSGLTDVTRDDEVIDAYRCAPDDLLLRSATTQSRQIKVPKIK